MNNAQSDEQNLSEREIIYGRARAYVFIRLAFDALLLLIFLVEPGEGGFFPPYWVFIADALGLLLYGGAVRRWPVVSTYLSLIFSTLLLITFDFSLGEITFIPWLFLIALSLAGGLIVTRIGFNSLATLSILGIFGIYLAEIYLGRIPLPVSIDPNLMLALSAATALVILMLNGFVEMLVAHLFQTQETLIKTRAQLIYTRGELELRRHEIADMQRQVRRSERHDAIGRIAEQFSKSLHRPLTRIEEILDLSPEDVLQPDTLTELRDEVHSALSTTDGLEQFGRLRDLHVETVNLDDILATELAQLFLPEDVALTVEQPPVFPPIQADMAQIRMLVHHLLDNALQVVGEGGAVGIKLEPASEGVRFSISNDGPDIPPEQQELIFEPLYTTQPQGFGLGLAICRRVAQAHGGRISVKSGEGEGTTFTVYLPHVPRHSPEELAQDAAA